MGWSISRTKLLGSPESHSPHPEDPHMRLEEEVLSTQRRPARNMGLELEDR